MKYSFRYILENRYDPKRSRTRIIAERYVVTSRLTKFLAPPFVWFFTNLGIHADVLTFASIISIIGALFFFISGKAILAIIAIFFFAMFDTIDGDVARIRGVTPYGGVLDSFGADFFYSFMPAGVGYYLFSERISTGPFSPEHLFLSGALVSITLILYRIIDSKMVGYLRSRGEGGKMLENKASRTFMESGSLKQKLIAFYRHEMVRGNFFAEPGLILWFSVGILFGYYEFLGWYLFAVLVYNIGYLFMNLARAYITFRGSVTV